MSGQRIRVRAVPGAKKDQVREEAGVYKVYVTAPAVDGKANKALVKVLAAHFGVRKSRVEIVRGEGARDKVVVIAAEKR